MGVTRAYESVRSAAVLGAAAIFMLFATSVFAQSPAKPAARQPAAASADGLKANGTVPVGAQKSLVIRGLPGQIVVTTKKSGNDISYLSRAKDRSGSPRPLAVTVNESTITFSPPAGGTIDEGTLRVEAPAALGVSVEADGGTVLVDGFAGAVELTGTGTTLRAQALTGSLKAVAQGGSLALTNVTGASVVQLLAKAALTSSALRGSLDLKSQDSSIKVQGVAGACRIEAQGGSAELTALAGGADLHLVETPTRLIEAKGDLSLFGSGAVTFGSMTGSLRFDMDGGSLRGQGNQGPVWVRAQRTDVTLSQIVGDVDLDVTRGRTALQRATGAVSVRAFAGDVKLGELQGPLRLDMDGGNAEVSFGAIAPDRDSSLTNNGGDISVRFPGNASCTISAKARSGKLTSELPSIKVPQDATEASGSLGQGKGPQVSIEADGNVRLSVGNAAAPAPQPAPPPS